MRVLEQSYIANDVDLVGVEELIGIDVIRVWSDTFLYDKVKEEEYLQYELK